MTFIRGFKPVFMTIGVLYVLMASSMLVRGAPEFMFPAYAVYAEAADPKLVAPALAGLRHVAAAARKANAAPRRRR